MYLLKHIIQSLPILYIHFVATYFNFLIASVILQMMLLCFPGTYQLRIL